MRRKQLLRDRQALLDEIAALQEENLRLLRGEPVEPPVPDSPEEEVAARPRDFSRFPLLRAVDEKYENTFPGGPRLVRPQPTLLQIAGHLRGYAAAHFGIHAGRPLFAHFLGAMAASDFLLLRGENPPLFCRAAAAAWGQEIEVIPARGDDSGSKGDILGEPGPAAGRYHETGLLRAVYEAGYREGVSFALLEDAAAMPERRLARLLPLLSLSHNNANFARKIALAETAWPGDPALLEDGALPWPGNLWVVGTLPAGAPPPSPQLRAPAMEFCLPAAREAKLAALENPSPVGAAQLRGLFAHAREVYALPEESLRHFALLEQYLAEHMELSLGAQALPQLRSFGGVSLACGLRPNEALDGFLYHRALRRLETADPAALKYELPGLRRFLAETFGRRALPLSMEYLDRLEAPHNHPGPAGPPAGRVGYAEPLPGGE
ncbi:MAG: hypothetical protein FWE98_03395 [Oscillospiraceae bacterium]|nr:hypothetical protein [Oscillospiraceae bacterium]